MDAFVIKQHDTAPSLAAVLSVDDVPLVIPGGAAVTFTMRPRVSCGDESPSTEVVTGAGVVVDGPTGAVRYDWAPGDTALAGLWNAEFKVSVAGLVTTYPSQGYIPINITPDLT